MGTAMLAQLRRVVIAADHDLWEALVVAQQHVEARLQRLDQVDLEQQGVGFGAGGDELHRARRVDHVGDAVGVEAALRVLHDALLQALGLADVQDLVVLADHPIDAGRIGQARDLVLDQGGAAQGVGEGGGGGVVVHDEHIGESERISDGDAFVPDKEWRYDALHDHALALRHAAL
jgi:ribosomal protein L30/L7E